jgi:NAD(P)-dependent dehydrogenase (short-subunit alcohol dehydrogenase family)
MKGKTVVITGGSSGIGKQLAINLASAGARVALACRERSRADAARAEIARAAASAELAVIDLDLATQASVRRCAADIIGRFGAVDVLVNNAGIQLTERRLGPDGIELVFATNVLGPHLLTLELLPALERARAARIVTIASSFAGELDVDDLEFERRPWNATKPYKQSKACNRLLTWELARRLEGTGVTANAVSPGMARTGLYRGLGAGMRLFMRGLQAAFGVSVEQAADTATWLASAPDAELAGANGRLFEKRAAIECTLADPELERRLWQRCEAMLVPAEAARAAPAAG